jgi:hypothetical protein
LLENFEQMSDEDRSHISVGDSPTKNEQQDEPSKLVDECDNFSDEEEAVGDENKFYERLPGGIVQQQLILPEHQTPE